MTTTNVFQGLEGNRVSSKVLRPPGGGSSNIFGDPEPPRGGGGRGQQQQAAGQTNVLGQPIGQSGASSGGPEPRREDRDLNNAASTQQGPAGVPSAATSQEAGRFPAKKQQDSHSNIFGGDAQQQGGQRNRRKGDSFSAEQRMERNMMAFNDHGAQHDESMWALEADLQEQRKSTLANNRHHAKAPVTDTYSNLFGEQRCSPDNGGNKRRLANTVSEYNIITGILNTPQMMDHNSPQSTNFTTASRNQRNRGAFNPITGEDYEQSPQAQPQRRVMNPPGGKSSGLW